MEKTSGILLIAMGHPYYGSMAHNLAVSLKAAEPSMPIALVYAGPSLNHLSQKQKEIFDQVIVAPLHSYTKNGETHYIKAKTFLYDFSPFDNTLYLDVDMLWLPRKKPSELFQLLERCVFTMANHGHYPLTSKEIVWAKVSQIKEAYDFTEGQYYAYSSEVMLFSKCEKNKKYFDTAKEIWDNPRVKMISFAQSIPDEFAFSVASVICDHHPHATPWQPSYWFAANGGHSPDQDVLFEKYYLLSMGREVVPERTQIIYNRLANSYFCRGNLGKPWRHRNKRQFLKERVTH